MALWWKAFCALQKMGRSHIRGFVRTHVREWLRRSPQCGRQAPDAWLIALDDERGFFRLRERIRDKPLVLIFGSFTCPPFRHTATDLIAPLYERFCEVADFLTIYIKEAHADDEWPLPNNVEDSACYRQPRLFQDRLKIAEHFVQWQGYPVPVAVDDMKNTACRRYAAYPERLYVIAEDGTVAYRGGRGPFEYNPGELEAWLEQHFS